MPDLDLYPTATSVSVTDRLIIRQTDTVGAVHTRKIPLSLLPSAQGGTNIVNLGLVTSIAANDSIVIVQGGSAELISFAAVLTAIGAASRVSIGGGGANSAAAVALTGAINFVQPTAGLSNYVHRGGADQIVINRGLVDALIWPETGVIFDSINTGTAAAVGVGDKAQFIVQNSTSVVIV